MNKCRRITELENHHLRLPSEVMDLGNDYQRRLQSI